MKDGIYYVTFRSNMQDFGNGTVVVRNHEVNGGDFVYSYKGRVLANDVILQLEQHDKSVTSVFGDVGNFTLGLFTLTTPTGYILRGGVQGMPETMIEVEAKFIGDLY
ncbi:negative regulator GrlR [Moellerella wisconsensis]|uniref:GrlR family regulatory protein n=1 Tax=Morganellaceae TaxID=1903414 RepID=UPI0010BE286B|nr:MULTISPECIES: GrlR family regulatory protein [Morganellaceae]QCJ70459.1 negative regulator GrlR [Providencia heimbachae]UNH43522.1 negative regulator GrlR [Moellerella wisconsensis]